MILLCYQHQLPVVYQLHKPTGVVVRKGEGLGYDFKRQRIVKKNLLQKNWSGHDRTGDCGPEAVLSK